MIPTLEGHDCYIVRMSTDNPSKVIGYRVAKDNQYERNKLESFPRLYFYAQIPFGMLWDAKHNLMQVQYLINVKANC